MISGKSTRPMIRGGWEREDWGPFITYLHGMLADCACTVANRFNDLPLEKLAFNPERELGRRFIVDYKQLLRLLYVRMERMDVSCDNLASRNYFDVAA